ncbi:exopolysaccharide biosynthesis protein [Reyranella sp.]|uniref:exopolysaccharide biosynthesis protein n=1 Tax=Reyranella sp. TaxID=1929291 RepID=UPI003BAA69B0
MKDNFGLLATLDQLFSGDTGSILTLDDFLGGLQGRSYAFAIAAINLPNCVPTGIPWLSTITGVPMLFLFVQSLAGRPAPSLPAFIGQRGLSRGRLQAFLGRARRHIQWLERNVHARFEGWVSGLPRHLVRLALATNIAILAVPIPFDNLLPAWAILFFSLALIEDDGLMAMLGWFFTLLTAAWTLFLLLLGHAAVVALIVNLRHLLFD